MLRWQIAQQAEIRWWKNYLKKKEKGPYLKWKKAYWQTLLDLLGNELILNKNAHVLDAGCGPAGVFILLNEQTECMITAIDPLLDKYTNEIPFFDQNDYPNIEFVNTGIEDFDIAQTQLNEKLFDSIFCMNAINHVHDIDKSWDILTSSLRPNGQLVVTIDAHNSKLAKKVFAALPGDILHPHQYTLKEYKDQLLQRNFVIKQEHLIKEEKLFNHYLLLLEKS